MNGLKVWEKMIRNKMIGFDKIEMTDLGVTAEVCSFVPSEGAGEWHIILHVNPGNDLFQGQIERIYKAEDSLLLRPELSGARYVMKRYFLSDSTNQQPMMRSEPGVSISAIQQQPLDGSKVAVWLYAQSDTEVVQKEDNTVAVLHNGYTHLWNMGMISPSGDSAAQTRNILENYERILQANDATLADNCVRTWFFVRDVDTQYKGLVTARKENFISQGLTEKTHYIASTGIGGNPADTDAIVQMGAYALKGVRPEQQTYLYAPTHLNPTYEYGVTFERGTALDFGDRRQVFISGTASIDNKGQVVHVGDIVNQTIRMWENVEKLLEEASASFEDVMQIVVYLRDIEDYRVVSRMFREKFPSKPVVIVLAPICRPTWLIEMECIAIVPQKRESEFNAF